MLFYYGLQCIVNLISNIRFQYFHLSGYIFRTDIYLSHVGPFKPVDQVPGQVPERKISAVPESLLVRADRICYTVFRDAEQGKGTRTP